MSGASVDLAVKTEVDETKRPFCCDVQDGQKYRDLGNHSKVTEKHPRGNGACETDDLRSDFTERHPFHVSFRITHELIVLLIEKIVKDSEERPLIGVFISEDLVELAGLGSQGNCSLCSWAGTVPKSDELIAVIDYFLVPDLASRLSKGLPIGEMDDDLEATLSCGSLCDLIYASRPAGHDNRVLWQGINVLNDRIDV